MYAAPAPAPQRNVFSRVVRLLMKRVMYASSAVGNFLKPRWLSALVITMLLGVVAVQTFLLVLPAISSVFTNQPSDNRTTFIAPPQSVLTYIEAQRNFDVNKMWEAYSGRAQAALLDNGNTKEALKARLDQFKSNGIKFQREQFIGAKELSNGQRMFFYAVEVQVPGSGGLQTIPTIFLVDDTGQLVNVDPNLAANQ
jgi:hypothetical protein